VLKVESSDTVEVLTFTCAYASGDEESVSPLVYREEHTPFTMTITADRFVGLFLVKSGKAALVVSAECGKTEISASWPVVVLEKEGLQLKTEGF